MTNSLPAQTDVQQPPPKRGWRREVLFLLAWLVIQGLVNLIIYPYIPKYDDPELNKLSRKLHGVVSRYDERRVTAFAPETSPPTSKWTLPYRLMRPKSSKGMGYPLLIFLHGAGERGNENLRQLQSVPAQMSHSEWRSQFPCFVAAPQCPPQYSWSHTEIRDSVIAMIDELLQECPEIDSRRIYLAGISMGGHGSWTLAAHRPDLFAAVIPVCGGGSVEDASKLIHVPLWAVHGDADTVVPVDGSRRMIAAILAAGGKPEYTELAGVGHDCWNHADQEGLLAWMFSQSRK